MYAALFGMIFVESGIVVGFLLPGDSIVFAAGLLAAEPGSSLSLPLLAVGCFACAAAGNAVGYWTGHRFGRPWVLSRSGRARAHLERAERFYARSGPLAVVVARFVPWARTFVPVVAGVAGMNRRAFTTATLAGAAVWGAGMVVLGYFAHDVPWVPRLAVTIAEAAVVGSVAVPIAGAVLRRMRSRGERSESRTSPQTSRARSGRP